MIVELDVPGSIALRHASISAKGAGAVARADAQLRLSIKNVIQREVAKLAGVPHRVTHEFSTIPFMAMRASPEAIDALERLRADATAALVEALSDRAIFEGSTESALSATEALENVQGLLAQRHGMAAAEAPTAKKIHVVAERADEALRVLTGQAPDCGTDTPCTVHDVARWWGAWWVEQTGSANSVSLQQDATIGP